MLNDTLVRSPSAPLHLDAAVYIHMVQFAIPPWGCAFRPIYCCRPTRRDMTMGLRRRFLIPGLTVRGKHEGHVKIVYVTASVSPLVSICYVFS